MRDVVRELFQAQGRLSAATVRILVGLSVVSLLIAAGGFFFDGWHRVAYISAFVLIALGNFVRALGSMLPEERGAHLARLAVTPIAALMFVALAITLLFQSGVW